MVAISTCAKKIFVFLFCICAFATEVSANEQSIIKVCVNEGNVTNNSAPIELKLGGANGCNYYAAPELGLAEVRFVPYEPKLVDLRTIKSPRRFNATELLEASMVLSVESMAYQHVKQPAIKARVLQERALLHIGEMSVEFRPFQYVDLGEGGEGWLGRIKPGGNTAPFFLNDGETRSHTTMFKPTAELTWRQTLEVLEDAELFRVDLFAVIAGTDEDMGIETIITSFCAPDLHATKERIHEFIERYGKQPNRIHVYCDGS